MKSSMESNGFAFFSVLHRLQALVPGRLPGGWNGWISGGGGEGDQEEEGRGSECLKSTLFYRSLLICIY